MPTRADAGRTVTLTFELELNPRVYEDSLWGDPPQVALWLENEDDGDIRMVRVTHRTAACDWEGKVECCVALPYWMSFYNRQTGAPAGPTWQNPAVNAITCATPRTQLVADIELPRGTRWKCFVEVNVSGDFNVAFPRFSQAGISDTYGNGQPSLVYRSRIEAIPGTTSRPELIGRTDQYDPVDDLSDDLQGITTARDLIRRVEVSCL
ncbi:MAG: hypothetical protein JW993_08245 [Sedimentisphaerales bacterium]|nr:hypothetical protein [Sedimentisphaerales bacterium]